MNAPRHATRAQLAYRAIRHQAAIEAEAPIPVGEATEIAGINMNGHHYVRRGADFRWMHPGEIQTGDLDCSFMNDAEFFRAVQEVAA